MAKFCTKCGAALEAGSNFCTACGTSQSGTDAPPAGATQSTAAPPKSGGALKVILIVVGICVGFGVLAGGAAMVGFWKFSRAVKVDPSGQVSISTPGGQMTVGSAAVSEAELGVPLYPGAKSDEGNVRISSAEGTMTTYGFKTSDSPAQVMAFYRAKLGPKATYIETPDGGMIHSSESEKEGFMITVGRDESNRQTAISIVRGHSKKAL